MKTKQITKYLIIEEHFNNRRIKTFQDENEWRNSIDEIAVDSIDRGSFRIEVYEFEQEIEEEIKTQKVKIFGTQGRKDTSVYVSTIPEEWGVPIFCQEIEYFQILQNEENGKYYPSYDSYVEEYDTKEECIEKESPSQYLNYY